MADLYVDMDSLRRTRSRLSRIAELLETPCRELRGVPLDSAGHEVLRQRLDSFADEWSYGIGKLGEFSEGTCEALQNVVDTFTDVDTELADGLSQAQEQS